MGFNIAGIVINKNLENSIETIEKAFSWNLAFVEEINFEQASENWKEESICDIYFSSNGTFIFLNMEMCIDEYKMKGSKVLTYALSETSMSFNVNITENGFITRSLMESDGQVFVNKGEKLEIEYTTNDTSEIIWNQIEEISGENFWDIEPSNKALRYKLLPFSEKIIETPTIQAIEKQETPKPKIEKIEKQWWQFWK